MPEEIYSRSPFELAQQYVRCINNSKAEAIWRASLNEEERSLLGTYNFRQSVMALCFERIIDISLSEFTQMFTKVFRFLGMRR